MVITGQQTQKNRLATELAFESFDEIKPKIKNKSYDKRLYRQTSLVSLSMLNWNQNKLRNPHQSSSFSGDTQNTTLPLHKLNYRK